MRLDEIRIKLERLLTDTQPFDVVTGGHQEITQIGLEQEGRGVEFDSMTYR